MKRRGPSIFVTAEAATILASLRKFFASQSIEHYLIGGYVRDGLLGRASRDIDVTVAGDALSVARQVADFFGAKFVLLNEKHQVARVVFLQDQEQWYLDFAAMRGPIESDLGKRDFTINATAVKLEQLESGWNQVNLIDPLDGVGDIEKKLIRATNDAAFFDDPARLLRAFRLAAELNFSIDSQTEALVQRDCKCITGVSCERVRDELGRILETNNAADTLHYLDRIGLLNILIPELAISREVQKPEKHFCNVLDHSLETVAAVERLLLFVTREDDVVFSSRYSAKLAEYFGEEVVIDRTRKALLKLAALLHNTAKSQNRQIIDKKEKASFPRNDPHGATVANNILERLRFSSREKRMILKIIDRHVRLKNLSDASELPTPRAIYRYFKDTGDVGIDTMFLSLANHWAIYGLQDGIESCKGHVEIIQYMLAKWFQEKTMVSPPKLINGHDLINHFGLAPGREISELLESVQEAYALGEIETKEDALYYVRKKLDKRSNAKSR